MEYLLLALDSTRRRPAQTIASVALLLVVMFGVFTVLDVLVKRNIITFSYESGYMYMANINCPGQNRGDIIDTVLRVSMGITGPVFFARGANDAIREARGKTGSGCRLVSVVQRKPYYKIVYPR